METSLWRQTALAVLLLALGACGGGTRAGAAPTAAAGNALTAPKRSTVTLDGSGSSDPGGHALSYLWSQTSGESVVLSSNTSARPTFTAPGASGALGFSLVVNNGAADSAPSTVQVTVVNRAPLASSPAALTVAASSLLALDGSASSDPDGDPLTFHWTQTGGTTVTLSPDGAGRAVFTSPAAAATLTFSLVVNDGEASSGAAVTTVAVQAPGQPAPVASAGPDQTTPRRAHVQLTGTASHTHGGTLAFSWQQVSGAGVTLQGAASSSAGFTAPAAAGDLVFSFTVTESGVSSAASTVTVHVKNFAPTVSGVSLSPSAPKRGDALSVSAATADPDGDALTLSVAWTRNGAVVPGATGTSFPAGNQLKGDVISAAVTANDGDLSATSTATTTIVDSPAVLTSAAPDSAAYGAPLTFQLTATDPDGDAVPPFELEYGPAGFSVDSAGLVSWTPGGPLFERRTDVNWAVRLHGMPAARLAGTITVLDPARQVPLARTNPGIPVGNTAIDVQDFDGTGVAQALIGASRSVYLLGKTGGTFGQTWAYPFDLGQNAPIAAVASGDVDGDGHREIFFASGPFVVKLDGLTRREVARFGAATASGGVPAGPYCTALRYADLDLDGHGELVCLGLDSPGFGSAGRVYVLDAATLQLLWKTPSATLGGSLAVGNVDADPALEIVTSAGFVFDGATQQNEWAYGPGFGTAIDIGDVMGDGVGKIVGTNSGVAARVFDAVLKAPILDVTGSSISGESALRVADLDGSAPAAIVVGDGQWGNVTAFRYDSVTHGAKVVAQVPVPGDGVSAIGVGDLDGSGTRSFVFGSDYYSSGRDYLDLVHWNTPSSVLWEGPAPAQLDGPFYGAQLARLSASSKQLVYLTPGSQSGYGGSRLLAMDPATGAVTVSAEVDSNWSRDSGFSAGDVLGTGVDQLLLSTSNLYTNYFAAFDLAAGARKWSSPTTSGQGVAIAHADLNQDGIDDFIGLTSDGHVQAWDVAHQTLIWGSDALGSGQDLAVADLDGDHVPELLALTADHLLVFTAGSGTYRQTASYAVSGTQLLVADTDGDTRPEVYVLASSFGAGGTIYQLDNTLKLLNSWPMQGASALALERSAFGRKNLVVATGDTFGGAPSLLRIVDPSSGKLVWSSPPLAGLVPRASISFCDPAGTGALRLAWGTSTGMFVTR